MLSYENNELLTIKVCPRCAKEGRGRGVLSNENRFLNDGSWIECKLCGWWGDQVDCQEYCFPCEVRRVVVMDLEVLQNLWAFALRKDEKTRVVTVDGAYYDALPTFDIRAEDCKDQLIRFDLCSIQTALQILVARGCLLPGFYKIIYGG